MVNALSGGNNFANISSFVSSNAKILQKSMVSIAAGQKVLNPSNGAADYFTGNAYNAQVRGYEDIRRELFQGLIVLDLASKGISQIYDDLNNIMGLAKEFFRNSGNETIQKYIQNDIENVKNLITQTMDNTVFNHKNILKNSSSDPIFEARITPGNIDFRFKISFGADMEVDVSKIDLTESESDVISAIHEQLNRAAKYMGAMNGFKQGIESQININEISANTMQFAAKNILGTDDLDDIIGTTRRQIQQQAAISMLAQGNAMRTSVLNLFKF